MAVNPRAGSGAGARASPEVVRALREVGHEVDLVQVDDPVGLRARLASALAGKPEALVVVGGDGMVHIGINAIAGTAVPLAIVPAGTGNDIARSLGLPVGKPPAAAASLVRVLGMEPRSIDLGRITSVGHPDVWFAAVCSAGLDAVVNARANRWSWPRGRVKYVLALLRELPFFRPPTYGLSVDGRETDIEAILVCISNMRSVGGGMLITPGARYDDGRLDLLTVDPMPRLKLLTLFPLIFSGRHVGLKTVHLQTVSSVSLDVPGITLFADGEPVGRAPVDITVVPAALKVFT
ncbi:diacylglycerol/lipid kinase family protein [Arthrobacter tecti]